MAAQERVALVKIRRGGVRCAKIYFKESENLIITDQIKTQMPALQTMLKEAGESL